MADPKNKTYAFKQGDIVVLKSGGPPMTIDELPNLMLDSYSTRWFKGATQEHGRFGEHLLVKYEPPAKK
ncbi:DUF2158 domain-containing protein [Methylosinus sp. R-45379]|uniref:DUF2158 domain-containing protein n=1 Tax=Methylosinus sp. R-45379 TaxID=980563 RepID=UPI000A024962|nr:DUF2158 domain-containing protein [Methylosinus sp. R-45379]